jgi:chromosome segregation ATPase
MEVIVFLALILVVVVKGFTTHSLHALEAKIRAAQSDEADITQRLQSTESSLRALEKEHKTLEQEVKHLENDKDLATLEVVKAGGRPITEEQLQQLMGTVPASTSPSAKQANKQAETPQEKQQAPDANNESETDSQKNTPAQPPNKQMQNLQMLHLPKHPVHATAFWWSMTMMNFGHCSYKP